MSYEIGWGVERKKAQPRETLEREIVRLRAERDEARRDICRWHCTFDTDWMSGPFPMKQSSPQDFATLYGWDCFGDSVKQ